MKPQPDELEIARTSEQGSCVFRICGEVDMRSSPRLRNAIVDAAQSKAIRIVIDLSGVSYMDSSGVGTMVYVKREIEKSGGTLILAGMQTRVRGLFEITQLEKFFQIRATLAEALGA